MWDLGPELGDGGVHAGVAVSDVDRDDRVREPERRFDLCARRAVSTCWGRAAMKVRYVRTPPGIHPIPHRHWATLSHYLSLTSTASIPLCDRHPWMPKIDSLGITRDGMCESQGLQRAC